MKILLNTPIGPSRESEVTAEHALLMIESGENITVLEALPKEWQYLTTSPIGLALAKGN